MSTSKEAPMVTVTLVGGPADGKEYKVSRNLHELKVPIPTTDTAMVLDDPAPAPRMVMKYGLYTRGLIYRDIFFFAGHRYL